LLFQIAKRQLHRPVLVYRNPTLNVIDGITVTDEERTKAQIYFTDFQQQQVTEMNDFFIPCSILRWHVLIGCKIFSFYNHASSMLKTQMQKT
jgi:hypothetical protein